MNLYFRLLALLFRLPWLPRKALLDESRLALRVWPTDCDLNLHLNDGRYVTLMGLGRLHLVTQIGLAGRILRERWRPITAGTVRFSMPAFSAAIFSSVSPRKLVWS